MAATAPKSTSLPGSPLHAISSENGPSKPEKIDVTQTTRLKGKKGKGRMSPISPVPGFIGRGKLLDLINLDRK